MHVLREHLRTVHLHAPGNVIHRERVVVLERLFIWYAECERRSRRVWDEPPNDQLDRIAMQHGNRRRRPD